LNGPRGASQILSSVATIHRSVAPAVVSHYNATPVIDIFGSVEGADLGHVAAQIEKIVASASKDLPKGSRIAVRGQVQTMKASFNGLLIGLVAAIVLVYILIVVNFQSLLDSFIIITALPGALAGIVWMLFLTHTTVSVPALTGAIMCMGSPPPTAYWSSALRASAWTPATALSKQPCKLDSRACGRFS